MRLFEIYLREYLTEPQRKKYAKYAMSDRARQATDHFFGVGNDMVRQELEDQPPPAEKGETHQAIEKAIGQEISIEDYKKGTVKDRYNRDVKIGRLIKDEKLRNQFANDPMRQGVRKSGYYVTIHRGVEVAGQTNSAANETHPQGHSWGGQSCKNVDTGCNRRYLKGEIQAGTVVVFIHEQSGKEIYRATLHPFFSSDKSASSTEVVYRLDAEYGVKNQQFTDKAHEVATALSSEYTSNYMFDVARGVYLDSRAASILHPKLSQSRIIELFDSAFNVMKASNFTSKQTNRPSRRVINMILTSMKSTQIASHITKSIFSAVDFARIKFGSWYQDLITSLFFNLTSHRIVLTEETLVQILSTPMDRATVPLHRIHHYIRDTDGIHISKDSADRTWALWNSSSGRNSLKQNRIAFADILCKYSSDVADDLIEHIYRDPAGMETKGAESICVPSVFQSLTDYQKKLITDLIIKRYSDDDYKMINMVFNLVEGKNNVMGALPQSFVDTVLTDRRYFKIGSIMAVHPQAAHFAKNIKILQPDLILSLLKNPEPFKISTDDLTWAIDQWGDAVQEFTRMYSIFNHAEDPDAMMKVIWDRVDEATRIILLRFSKATPAMINHIADRAINSSESDRNGRFYLSRVILPLLSRKELSSEQILDFIRSAHKVMIPPGGDSYMATLALELIISHPNSTEECLHTLLKCTRTSHQKSMVQRAIDDPSSRLNFDAVLKNYDIELV